MQAVSCRGLSEIVLSVFGAVTFYRGSNSWNSFQ